MKATEEINFLSERPGQGIEAKFAPVESRGMISACVKGVRRYYEIRWNRVWPTSIHNSTLGEQHGHLPCFWSSACDRSFAPHNPHIYLTSATLEVRRTLRGHRNRNLGQVYVRGKQLSIIGYGLSTSISCHQEISAHNPGAIFSSFHLNLDAGS